VCRFNPRKSFLILLKFAPTGTDVFNQSGNLTISFFLGFADFNSSASVAVRGGSGLEPTKSLNEGPVFNLSENFVDFVADGVTVSSEGVAVAYSRARQMVETL